MDEPEDGSKDGSRHTRSEVNGSGIEGFANAENSNSFEECPVFQNPRTGERWTGDKAYGKDCGLLHSAKLAWYCPGKL